LEGRPEGYAPEPRLILVDSSVWIDFFSSAPGPASDELAKLIEHLEPLALTGVVVAEVLQGLTRDARLVESYLAQVKMLEPQGFSVYRNAATIYRTARSKGISLATIDVLIASVALEYDAAVFTLDKDFSHIARITSLRLHV
jgi:predicted nucleic acid-binding protein